jgi:dTDP-4-dehydrorhamnose reductase
MIFVVGASGLVGWHVLQQAVREGDPAVGTYYTSVQTGLIPFAVTKQTDVLAVLTRYSVSVVVYCAAWSWVDGCEKDAERAFVENRSHPLLLAKAAADVGAQFVFLSTSYVFDGTAGPYAESAPPNPLSVYGKSKLAGEHAVMDATEGSAIIIRTMGVYGYELQAKNFVYQVVSNLRAGKRMKVPVDQRGNATDAQNLAAGVLALTRARARGIWNIAGPDPHLTRRDLAVTVARTFDLDESLFEFVDTSALKQAAPRPLHAGLLTTKATAHLRWRPAPWTPPPISCHHL